MRILVGMSGGIDSTFTAYTLKKAGHDVEGLVLKMHEYTDVNAAKEACSKIGIKLNTLDCTESFRKYVINDFINEYSSGRTPNPCTVCNRYVKISELCRYAQENGFDKAATGHYAEIEKNDDGRLCIRKGMDIKKDQSYMLWYLTQEQLGKMIFPLSTLSKDEIREAVAKTNFAYLTEKKESQEICFIPDNDYAKYIENIKGAFPSGNFIDKDGNVLGQHKGIIHYTVGQRKGLGIALGAPAFITAIDPTNNTITLEKQGKVLSESLTVGKLNYQALLPEQNKEYTLDVKVRYAAPPVKATVTFENDKAKAVFLTPVRAVTPGQSAVFYIDDKIAFGGVIE